MSLSPPDLDSRTFKDLVKEARARIPRYTPDWTNLNDADPGMTLVKLQAWLTETLLYQLNQLPELNYIKFLDLLNVKPIPASAASTELTFKLKKLSSATDPLLVLVPKSAQVAVDDPDLTEEVVFETDYTLTALNAAVAAIIVKQEGGSQPLKLITEYDEKEAELKVLHAFYPFTDAPAVGDVCHIGILLRPQRKKDTDYSEDVFPAGQLDLAVNATEVFEKDDEGNEIEGPFAEQSRFPWEVGEQAQTLEWEIYVGTDHSADFEDASGNQNRWKRLNLSDETAGLQDSGHVRLEIPENISSVSLQQLPREFWEDLGLKKPPITIDELIADLQDADLDLAIDSLDEDTWKEIGVPDDELNDLMNCCSTVSESVAYLNALKARVALDPSKVDFDSWIDLEVGYDDPAVPSHALHWLRVRVLSGDTQAALLNTFLLNTVPATAAVTRLEEQLGISDGRPAQGFTLTRSPVYYDPDNGEPHLELEVMEAGQSRSWQRVDDFYRQGPDNEVFLLDETSATITFGDGVRGRIPVTGAEVIARRYRYGGGAHSNAGDGSVTKLKSVLPSVDSVSNLRSAVGGQDAEALEETKLRASHELRSRDRAVSVDDFSLLAKQTPGVAIQRAYALARKRVNSSQELETANGAVTVVILPFNEEDTPQPSEAQLRAVCEYLDARRLITTELYVTGPRYKTVKTFEAEVRANSDADLKMITDSAFDNLLQYFHPLYGSEDGNGWPFGGDIFYGNVYKRLLRLAGVNRVVSLNIELEGESPSGCTDSLPVAEGHLIYLPRSVIDLKVVYDSFG